MGRCKKTGKVQHHNQQAALKAVNVQKKRNGDTPNVFKCDHCHKWHLGNSRAGYVSNLNRKIDAALAADEAKRKASKKPLDQPEQLSYSDS